MSQTADLISGFSSEPEVYSIDGSFPGSAGSHDATITWSASVFTIRFALWVMMMIWRRFRASLKWHQIVEDGFRVEVFFRLID